MSNEKLTDDGRVRQIMEQYIDNEYLASKLGLEDALLQLCTTIRQEERRAAFKDAITTVTMLRSKWEDDGAPTDRLIGADFIVEALEAAANETREEKR